MKGPCDPPQVTTPGSSGRQPSWTSARPPGAVRAGAPRRRPRRHLERHLVPVAALRPAVGRPRRRPRGRPAASARSRSCTTPRTATRSRSTRSPSPRTASASAGRSSRCATTRSRGSGLSLDSCPRAELAVAADQRPVQARRRRRPTQPRAPSPARRRSARCTSGSRRSAVDRRPPRTPPVERLQRPPRTAPARRRAASAAAAPPRTRSPGLACITTPAPGADTGSSLRARPAPSRQAATPTASASSRVSTPVAGAGTTCVSRGLRQRRRPGRRPAPRSSAATRPWPSRRRACRPGRRRRPRPRRASRAASRRVSSTTSAGPPPASTSTDSRHLQRVARRSGRAGCPSR